MNSDTPTYLDGNGAAGELGEVFAVDVTAAIGQCGGCNRRAPVAEARVYVQAPGLVVRCATCEHVLVRIVKTPTHTWLDLHGLRYLRFERSSPARPT